MQRSEVEQAIATLVASNKRATIRAIRDTIGRGSLQDITAHVKDIHAEAAELPSVEGLGQPVTGGTRNGDDPHRSDPEILPPLDTLPADNQTEMTAAAEVDPFATAPELPKNSDAWHSSNRELRYADLIANADRAVKLRNAAEAESEALRSEVAALNEKIRDLTEKLQRLGNPAAVRIPGSMRKHFSADAKGNIAPVAINVLGTVIESLMAETGSITMAELKAAVPELRMTAPARLHLMLFELRSQGRLAPLPDTLSRP